MTLLETIGSILVGLIILAGAALGLNSAFSNSRLNETEQNLITLRMQVQQMFSGSSDYTGLDNSLALQAGLVPKPFIKGSAIRNSFGGDITVAPVSGSSSFSVALTTIPQDECTKLAKFQTDAWLSVDVNGTDVTGGTVADVVAACSTSANTITYTAR